MNLYKNIGKPAIVALYKYLPFQNVQASNVKSAPSFGFQFPFHLLVFRMLKHTDQADIACLL